MMIGTSAITAALIILAWPVSPGSERIHSPYQLLERGAGNKGLTMIKAAGHYYQRIHDLSLTNKNRNFDEALRKIASYYELPYKIYGRPLQHVAIVGAGTGNDVAAALRCGVEHIDAVEIDPGILKLGDMYHPEKPYDDPSVNAVVNDARTFLRMTHTYYDMIVYGLLDSHTLLSHASSVRLDSFVYTLEALEEARQRLKPDGLLSLSFSVISDEIGRKIYLMMKKAFEEKPPICVRSQYDGSVIFLQSRNGALVLDRNLLESVGFEDRTYYYSNPKIYTDVPTDDWPFFYMPKRVYPFSYLGVLGLIILLSSFTTFSFIKQQPTFSSASFFFLGAGFMLIETKAITELGLSFGNTWQVIGITIFGILLMAFFANRVVQWFKIKRTIPWAIFLITSLFIGYLISMQRGFDSSTSGKISSVILLTCPIFFSGILFSILLSRTMYITGVVAINVLGAMAGGVLEYNSMYFGFRFLYILAILMYLLAILTHYLSKRGLMINESYS
jgi:spermidine synthase